MAKTSKQNEQKRRVARHYASYALREICDYWQRPVSAGEFAREQGLARNTGATRLKDLVKHGFAQAVKVRHGNVTATYYQPAGVMFTGETTNE